MNVIETVPISSQIQHRHENWDLKKNSSNNYFDNLIKQKYSRLSGTGKEDRLLIKSKVPRFGQTIAFNGQARWISLGQVVRLLQRLSIPEEGRKDILQL